MKEKTNWKREIIFAVVFAVVIIILMNIFCNLKHRDIRIEEFQEVCSGRLGYYLGYPDGSFRVVCKTKNYTNFEGVFVNG